VGGPGYLTRLLRRTRPCHAAEKAREKRKMVSIATQAGFSSGLATVLTTLVMSSISGAISAAFAEWSGRPALIDHKAISKAEAKIDPKDLL
jgi:hypothetical protein